MMLLWRHSYRSNTNTKSRSFGVSEVTTVIGSVLVPLVGAGVILPFFFCKYDRQDNAHTTDNNNHENLFAWRRLIKTLCP